MKRTCKRLMLVVLMFVAIAALFGLVGCGNVGLQGDALTAAETSTLDAYQAYQRAAADPASTARDKAYLQENFTQWRFFVRSAKKDLAWGPKLPGE